jgi:hypothetical protein
MNEASITRYITDTLDGVDVVVASREAGSPELAWGDTFFSYDPGRQLPPARRFPFATIVTKDYGEFDCASQLDRPGVFRLNIGVSKETYRSLFGPQLTLCPCCPPRRATIGPRAFSGAGIVRRRNRAAECAGGDSSPPVAPSA